MPELVGLIPAAGRGTRAYPYTRTIPKGMLWVSGTPLLEHTLAILRDQVGVSRVFIVVGSHGHIIREHFGDGEGFGVPISYVQNDRVELGLAHSVRLAGAHITGPFVMMLSDEYYQDTNHADLAGLSLDGALGYCGLLPGQEPEVISQNYTVTLGQDRVRSLVEKPARPQGGLLGTGTLLLSPQVFTLLEAGFARPGPPPDFMGLLGWAVQQGQVLRPFLLRGLYVNVNNVDSLNWANFLGRTKRFADASLSLIVQCQGYQSGLRRVVSEFHAQERVDEVLVVTPPGLAEPLWLAGLPKARWLPCPGGRLGFGSMLAYGIEQSRGDLLAIVEGDYCFQPTDLAKLLAYIPDADLVLGTRTTRQLIQQGSRMRGLVRLSHILLAKLVELLWLGHRVRLTDAGCTYRLLWRHCYQKIKEQVRSAGPEFVLEMTIETMRSRQRLIEVPVSFLHPNPDLAALYQHPSTFLRMLALVLRRRLGLM
ncbi:MAG: sugar phosphate nucleotidyltransferase [Thermodesulfobacteriota bacterium]